MIHIHHTWKTSSQSSPYIINHHKHLSCFMQFYNTVTAPVLAFPYSRDLGLPCWPSGKASASRAEDPRFESRLRRDFSRSSHTSDLKTGTPMATLPGAWRYRVSAGTGQPGVSILWLGEMESLICNFYLSVAAHKIVWAVHETHSHVAGTLSNQPTNKLWPWVNIRGDRTHPCLTPLQMSKGLEELPLNYTVPFMFFFKFICLFVCLFAF